MKTEYENRSLLRNEDGGRKLTGITFLRPYGKYQTHERAGFDAAAAAELVRIGVARFTSEESAPAKGRLTG